ncbi:AAA family ATPase [Sulfurimonas sp. SAG-AH-194-C21]|nr:DnaB-like helicase C-terminal domain-containing protein [Sulfurimonas sp. SAG-AH-194-C21]MDF1884125.1 AAA family ATPase [Sulfurimonas sp. SAG-AH-194-C21]
MHNLREIERVVLSSIIFEMSVAKEEEIERLQVKDFFSIAHQSIFGAIKDFIAQDKPIEEHLLSKYLIKNKLFDEQVMLNILTATPISNISSYVDQVINERKKRELDTFASKIKIMLLEKSDADEIVNYADSFLLSLGSIEKVDEPISMRDAIIEFENTKEPPKIETGLGALDRALNGGIELHQLVHIGGESGAGKTMLTLQILNNVAGHFGSLFLSFEMPRWKMAKRMKKFEKESKGFDNYFITDSGRDISEIKRTVKRWVSKHEIKFVVIDSEMKITHRSFKGENESNKIGEIQAELAQLCQELGIVIFLITQLSKSDIRNKTMSGLGSVKSDYEADMKLLILKDDKIENKRYVEIKKNRQDIKEYKSEFYIDTNKLVFTQNPVPVMVYEFKEDKVEVPVL